MRPSAAAAAPQPPPATPAPARPAVRRRQAGGPPQDHALYTCACGYLFEASVSASVRCPACGGEQAW